MFHFCGNMHVVFVTFVTDCLFVVFLFVSYIFFTFLASSFCFTRIYVTRPPVASETGELSLTTPF